MVKAISAPAILRLAMGAGAIPEGVDISRKGEASWTRNGLEITARIAKNNQNELDWIVQFADARFAEAMARFGRISIAVRGTDNDPMLWPSAADAETLSVLTERFQEAAGFVADRKELATLLTEKSDVVKGRVYAWLTPTSYPARLVQSLILARDMSDEELTDSALAKLSEDPIELPRSQLEETELLGPTQIDIRKSAQNWAKQYSKALGFPVPLPG